MQHELGFSFTTMSVHVSSPTWKLQLKDPLKKLILLKLADNSNDEGFCWPSIATIVRETEISESTVCKKLSELEKDGYLRRVKRQQTSTMYYLNLHKINNKCLSVRRTPFSVRRSRTVSETSSLP